MLCNSKLVLNFEWGISLVLNFKFEKTHYNSCPDSVSGPDSDPGSCVVWNVLYDLIQPIFPVPVPVSCSGPGVSQCEYTITAYSHCTGPGQAEVAGTAQWGTVDSGLFPYFRLVYRYPSLLVPFPVPVQVPFPCSVNKPLFWSWSLSQNRSCFRRYDDFIKGSAGTTMPVANLKHWMSQCP